MSALPPASGRHVNLNLLPVFVLVAEHLSFREAAKRTARSQSAVSAQIRLLEQQLSVPLFNRTTRSVKLTPFGEIFLESARESVHALDLGLNRIREAALGETGSIALTCSPSIAGKILPPITGISARSRLPQIRPDASQITTSASRRLAVDAPLWPRSVPPGRPLPRNSRMACLR